MMDYNDSTLMIAINEETITIINQKGRTKSFPRCGMTEIESFVQDLVKAGNLDELILDY